MIIPGVTSVYLQGTNSHIITLQLHGNHNKAYMENVITGVQLTYIKLSPTVQSVLILSIARDQPLMFLESNLK